MADLQSLPDEVISIILSYLADEKSLLYRLAIQSKRLSELVRPVLLRHVAFTIDPVPKSLTLLLRSVSESSLVASMIQDVNLGWSNGVPEIHEHVNALLGRLLQLRSLTLYARRDNPPWQHQFLQKNSMEFLAHVDLAFITSQRPRW